jgi:hypothetical protein
MTKAPRKQYQAASRPSGRAKQWKRDISGANAARLYDAMAHMHLDKLMVAGGRGKKVLKRALQEAEEWAEQRRRASAALRRLRRVRNVSGPVQYELRDPRLWHQLFAEIEPQDILGRG